MGKTVLLHQLIERFLSSGARPASLCYVPLCRPIFNGLPLRSLAEVFMRAAGLGSLDGCTLFLDDAHYLEGWEDQLAGLARAHSKSRFVAASALAWAPLPGKDGASLPGAGHGPVQEIRLSSPSFGEYLRLAGRDPSDPALGGMAGLNREFLQWLNFGGFPAALSWHAAGPAAARFRLGAVADGALHSDIPGLCGIDDTRSLHRLVLTLAAWAGRETTLESLSREAGLAKNTVKRYLQRLEGSFLVSVLRRTDLSGRRFERDNYFKAYLENPSMVSALLGPAASGQAGMEPLVQTAVLARLSAGVPGGELVYARMPGGTVSFVRMGERAGRRVPASCTEVRWSDRHFDRPGELASLVEFCRRHGLGRAVATTIEQVGEREAGGVRIRFVPAAALCLA